MRKIRWAATLVLAAALPLTACNTMAGDARETTSEAGLTVIPVTVVQEGKSHVFRAELAATSAQQSQGLMYRKALAPDAAMLFPFPQPKFASFWQKNMLISIDMIYIRADGSIDRIVENTIPGNEEPSVSGGEVAAVLEVAAGTAERLGFDERARVSWTLPQP